MQQQRLGNRTVRGREFRLAATTCANCSARLDTAEGRRELRPGDYVVCSHCRAVTIADSRLRPRPLTEDDLRDILLDPATFVLLTTPGRRQRCRQQETRQ